MVNYDKITANLRACSTREQAYALLNALPNLQTKKELIAYSKLIKSDSRAAQTKQMLQYKIVEGLIGCRINSEIINSVEF